MHDRRPREAAAPARATRDETIESFDGTRIAYRVGGTGEPWLVIANGYGGAYCAWSDILERLSDHCRYLIWDYRGLNGSAVPADRSQLRIEHHCDDLDRIRAAEGIDRMTLAAWSVGVQVALEQYRRSPDSVEALALCNGAHGRPLSRSTRSRLARSLMPPLLRGLRAAAPVAGPALLPPLRAVASRRWSAALLRRAGVFNGEAASLSESVRSILALDYRVYTHMILLAEEHDTEDMLGHIDVPALVVAGDRDGITPPALARTTASRIPGCVYREVAGATHYGLMEQPDLYASLLAELLTRRRSRAADGQVSLCAREIALRR
jgi:pimeloyl-ACP methyl ester carboxylesterase